jgi:alpha-galactosidase
VLLAAPAALHAALPTKDENSAASTWAQSALLTGRAAQPFSFSYGGKPSRELLAGWKSSQETRTVDAQRREHTLTWTDDATHLQVRCVAVQYADFPVVEWTLWLKNTGKENTPLLEGIHGLDVQFESHADGEFVLHGIRGDTCVAESFRPFAHKLESNAAKRFSPPAAGDKVSGKSSDGPEGWPYFNLQKPGGGVIIAVGWPGQWEATFHRDQLRGVRVKAGQQLTRLVLKPDEEIRTPSLTLLFWQGDDVVRAQNLWRSWYLAHVLPRIADTPQPPTTQIQVEGSLASWPRVQAYLDAGIKPDICWRDAGGLNTWYPSSGGPYTEKKAWLNTGTWEPDPAKYPQGFKPYSDKARASGMQFLLWFEPERVGDPNSWLGKNHPDWLMPGNSAGSVLNLGHPDALKWLIEHIDGLVKSQGLDWYREDLNGGNYGTAWRKNDAADRQGITENFYVQGHLAFWDALRRRNPNLHLDSCASGGRRNDLETMRRSVPLLRSDWSVTAFADAPLQREGNQSQTFGLSSWLPWQGAGVPFFLDRYSVRSYYVTGFGMIQSEHWSKSESKRADVERGYGEVRRIAPLLLGDYYPLTPYSLDTSSWIAWQFHRADLDESVVQAFRRPDAASDTLTVKLHGLDPEQRYEVENFDGGKEVLVGKKLLQGYDITLREKPAAAVLQLRAILTDRSQSLSSATRPLRIMPLGDSITRGSYLAQIDGKPTGLPNPQSGGWRKPLQDKLRAAGAAFDFVGELSYAAFGRDGVVDPTFDPDHHGLAGFSNSGILIGGVVPTPADVLAALGVQEIKVPGIVDVLKKRQPDVILLMSGANGFDAPARDQLIRTIGEASTAHLFVATILPQKSPRVGWGKVDDYNASLPAIVAAQQAAGKRITLVDMHVAITTNDLLADGVHPNQVGMDKMAEKWFAALGATVLEPSAPIPQEPDAK